MLKSQDDCQLWLQNHDHALLRINRYAISDIALMLPIQTVFYEYIATIPILGKHGALKAI